MKAKGKHIHRGDILFAVVKKSRLSVTAVAKRMGISRGTFYNHRDNPQLPFEILEQYGKVLQYDFSEDFSGMQKYALEEPTEPYGEPSTLEEAVRQRDYWKRQTDLWKDKYIQLLEEVNKRK